MGGAGKMLVNDSYSRFVALPIW